MSSTTDPRLAEAAPKKRAFHPSMLLYDQRYRSITIQIFALFLLMLGAAWLIDNVINNLRLLGRTFSFNFLWQSAGYDINQRPIEYNSQMTHGRAALVGFLNTIILAIMGCALATILGVLAGVLRLSSNWIVSRLVTIYVEIFRNIPTLIWILIFGAVMAESMPAPSTFRGDDPASSMLFDAIAITNRGVYIPAIMFTTELGVLPLGPISPSWNWVLILAVLVAGVFANKYLIAHATRVQNATGIRPKTWWKSILVLFGPVILIFIGLGAYLEYPELRGFNFAGGTHLRNSFLAMWLGLGIYTGAFIAEIVRGGILAISKGQTEAAFALGLQPGKTMRLVILPQALRVIIPPLISQYLNLTKNTSLGLAVGYMDLRSTLGGITINQTGRELEGMLLLMAVYLAISLTISGLMNVYNSRVKLKER
ncbi:amino acid ABC transporter permease [Roseinatronobacter bogoriensis]|nr:general L-amino acid transport system permease protein [Rhodobaca bogoriensis DSM 18756]TDW40958.1 general L-amino acid transport system permease protein [Rhodobaca barguzinensis]TDY74864.1 L-glutamine ABC transporter membrane protein /L-glutamate ABC transporter membrane protein /L-aspartate ABC transporter membrane protein /L-asparagine ABC transporter membrane protein [Rhodobaca bogoriensis DSM 18756]